MDVVFINPVLDAFINILPQLGFNTVEKKQVSLQGAMLKHNGVLINISVVGALKGTILIGMELEAAKCFASKMMMGMDVVELDSLAQSAISEMGNMVCANACTYFSQIGIHGLDISPPTLLIGQNVQVLLAVPKVIVVKFAVDDIPVDVYVGLMK